MVLVERRIGLLFAFFLSLIVLAGMRSLQLGTLKGGSLRAAAAMQQVKTIDVPAHRGTITDRKGVELAVSEAASDITATPYLVRDKLKVASRIAPLLGLSPEDTLKKLSAPGGYVWLGHRVPGPQADRIAAMRIDGIDLAPTQRRVYPRDWLASQVLGSINLAGTGYSGVEEELNSRLSGTDGQRRVVKDGAGADIKVQNTRVGRAGAKVELSLDANIQDKVEDVLKGIGKTYRPLGATAMVTDPRTGEILALANWPQVNANAPTQAPSYANQNRAVGYTYEPGSTFKAVTVAGALEDGLVTPDTSFYLPSQITMYDRTIKNAEPRPAREHDGQPDPGAVRQRRRDHDRPQARRVALRLLRAQVRLRQEDRHRPPRRGAGHRAPALQVLGNVDGQPPDRPGRVGHARPDRAVLRRHRQRRDPQDPARGPPRRRQARHAHTSKRIMKASTAAALRQMLEGVFREGGTAHAVQIPGYTLAGKTGTANKVDPQTGTYSDRNYIASFVGFAPANNPKLLISVMVDQPAGRLDLRRGGRGAGVREDRELRARLREDPAAVGRIVRAMVAAMLLGDLFGDRTLPPVDVTSLAFDARAVRPGALFFCVRGMTTDGHKYAPDALANGAVALVVDHPLDLGLPEVLVDDVRAAMAPAAKRFNGDPTAALAMVGVTGTNGKTTTTWLTRALLEAAGRQTGLIGTVTAWIGGVEEDVVSDDAGGDRPPAPVRRDARRRRRGVRHGGLLARARLHRADGIDWDVAAFTNLSQDHLDFHSDMEDYFLAKRRLFEVASAQGATLIACADDPYGARLAREFPRHDHDRHRRARRAGARDRPAARLHPHRLPRRRPRAARAAARALQRPQRAGRGRRGARAGRRRRDDRRARCRRSRASPGASSRSPPARTSRSSSTTRTSPRRSATSWRRRATSRGARDGRVIVVVGAGGDRDTSKRAVMGRAAAEGADMVVLTSDNPRSEDPEKIIDMVAEGAGDGAIRITTAAPRSSTRSAPPGPATSSSSRARDTRPTRKSTGAKHPFDDRERGAGGARCAAGALTASPQAAGARLVEPGDRGRRPDPRRHRLAPRGPRRPLRRPARRARRRRPLRPDVLAAGAWGVLVGEGWSGIDSFDGAILVAQDPLAALQRLANAWRHELGAQVIGITGSTGKTSTKDLTAAMVDQQRRVVATPLNLNTEIGLPLTILGAPADTEVLVLEMAMRGAGQIAELARIAEPDVGVIVNVGPVHLELLGTIEAIAATKAELIEHLPAGGTAIVPAGEPLLTTHLATLPEGVRTVTFGAGRRLDAASRRPRHRLRQRPHAPQRPGRAGRGARRRGRADRPPGGRAERAARAAPGAARRRRRHRRLLQRQPDVDARRPRRPRRVRSRTPRRRARRHAGAGPGRGPLPRGDRRPRARRRRRPARHGRPAGRRDGAGVRGRGASPSTAPPRWRRALKPRLAEGDTVLVKASRGVGLEVVAKELAA